MAPKCPQHLVRKDKRGFNKDLLVGIHLRKVVGTLHLRRQLWQFFEYKSKVMYLCCFCKILCCFSILKERVANSDSLIIFLLRHIVSLI